MLYEGEGGPALWGDSFIRAREMGSEVDLFNIAVIPMQVGLQMMSMNLKVKWSPSHCISKTLTQLWLIIKEDWKTMRLSLILSC
ncbi:hypothetical protein M5689_011410 [Euphorbia peplus]|nr:hypothetical protein M5689_011410 [Euphorbia peplus]